MLRGRMTWRGTMETGMRPWAWQGQAAGWRGRAPRAASAFLLGLALFAGLFWLVLPHLVSAERLTDALRAQTRARGGLEFSTASPPSLSLGFSPSLTLADVVLRKPGGAVFMETAQLTAGFSLTTLLTGKPRLREVVLTEPRLYLAATPPGGLPENGAEFSSFLMNVAGQLRDETAPFLKDSVGEVRIEKGTLVLGAAKGVPLTVPEIEATLIWPSQDASLYLTVNAQVAGEPVALSLSARNAAPLLGGGSTPASLSLALPGTVLRLEGMADFHSGFFSGDFTFEATDLQKLIAWHGHPPKGMESLRTARATAQLSTSAQVLRFDGLAFSINDTQASGIMDLALKPGSLPKFTGTLAFEDFDIGDIGNLLPLADQFTPARDDGDIAPLAAFDIRLSARQARIGGAVLGDVAASMLVGQGQALLDIGDSDFEGGRLTGRLSSGPQGLGKDMRMQLSLRDIDLAQLGERLGPAYLWPQGRGSLDFSLTSDRPFTQTRRDTLSGRATIAADRGRLRHPDAAAIRALAGQDGPLPLAQAGSQNFDYDRLDARLSIAKGAVILDNAIAENASDRLTLQGRIEADDALFLAGQLSSIGNAEAEPFSFTLGGTLAAPEMRAAAP